VRTVVLNEVEATLLARQDPDTAADGGFQALLVRLQEKIGADGTIELDAQDLDQIPRYAFDYKNGGWQNRLVGIFGRTLGNQLGR